MNAKRIIAIVLALAAMLALNLSIVSAQGGPNRGNNNNCTGANCTQDCPMMGQCDHPNMGNNNNLSNGQDNGNANNTQRNNGQRGNANRGSGWMTNVPPKSNVALTQEVIDLMIQGWTDEQHAYAVYGMIIDQFGAIRPFTNIQRSEAQHIAAWETMFARYGITIPAVPVFAKPSVSTLTEACTFGATAEVANYEMYNQMMTTFQSYPDLLYVAQSLQDASEYNHLPAFQNCAQ